MIKIDNDYLINANESCYTLERKTTIKDANSKNYGNEARTIEGYYTSIAGALEGYMKIRTREYVSKKEENTLKELLQEIQKTREFINKISYLGG